MTALPPDANTRLAAERTRLAQERTLMAWIRTCTSLIAFGFTIYQAFLYLSTVEKLKAPVVSPQIFGVTMILIGLIALALAWIQHRRSMKALQEEFGAMPFSIAGVIAALIAGLGAIALIGVTLRF
jgi:putative membrane protein